MLISIRSLNIIILITISFLLGCDTSSNVEPRFTDIFIKFYGGGSDFEAVDFQLDNDLGFIIIGNVRSVNSDSSQIVLIKTDELGNEQERSILDLPVRNAEASSIRVIPGAYLIGATVEVDLGVNRVFIATLANASTIIDSAYYAPPTSHRNVKCSQINFDDKNDPNTNGYLISGSAIEIGTGDTQTYTLRVISNGLTPDPQWDELIISGTKTDAFILRSNGISLLPTRNPSDYFVFGSTNDPETRDFVGDTFYSRRMLLGGAPEAEANYGAVSNEDIMGDAIRISENQYLLIGTNTLENDVVITQTNFNSQTSTMNETFNFSFGGSLDLQGLSGNRVKVGQGILVTGSVDRAEVSDVFLANADQSESNNFAWLRTFGFDGQSRGVKVFQNDDGSIMLLATVATFGSESTRSRIALIKTNSNGELK